MRQERGRRDDLKAERAQTGFCGALPESFNVGMLDALPCSISLVDLCTADYPLIYVNPAFEKLTGYKRKEIIGRNCRFLHGPDTDAKHKREMREAVEARRGSITEILNYRANGECFVNRVMLTPFPAQGIATHFIGAQIEIEDMAEHAQPSDTGDQALRELQHRVKNHLSILLATVRLDARRAKHASGNLEVVANRIESLALLYDELSLRNVADSDKVVLGNYVRKVARGLEALDKRHRVVVNVADNEILSSVQAASRVGQLLCELLTNAFKHAFRDIQKGTVEVTLTTKTGYIILGIKDDGSGLPAGSEWPRKGNMGARIVSNLALRLQGEIEVINGSWGTEILVRMPQRIFAATT